jgi:type III restriction enzyme
VTLVIFASQRYVKEHYNKLFNINSIIETKGDDRDNSDSKRKIRLGKLWASKAGENYRYFMVFNNAKLDGANSIGELIDILKGMI